MLLARRTTTFTALAAAALLLTGCGAGTGSADKGAPKAPPSHSTGTCASHVELTAADNGHTVCVTRGGEVRLTLDGTKDRPWAGPTVTGGSLTAINAGLVLRPGDATAAYSAQAPGTSTLTSSRPLCAQKPGEMSCKGLQSWTATVRVK
ncbi:hypothetical protein KUM39_08495 [Streptomyces sp. J2-1]|uniref:hypothetical protein n=1 Tax=Streptomyces corallincola TaxID=2851888 RepID=UPI001C391D45|nr:hypothetical protein [Streptomyces corallincola]MBV2354402.1 hypothetical protein [Streptomyces corallincola]